jgi:N-acetylmuramoyl-L-alanine amidase
VTKISAQSAQPVSDAPVFKVQLFVSSRELRQGDPSLKGIDNFESYREGQLLKYTTGNSTDYNEIFRLRKSVLDKFPDAFIIAFKNGNRMDVNQAIKEFLNNRKK